jgi:hypothetical protein
MLNCSLCRAMGRTGECSSPDRASQNWEDGVEGPNACERTYTLASATESTNLKPFADSFCS